jgi:hypothetical protein
MYKLFFLTFLLTACFFHPVSAQYQAPQISANYSFNSERFLGLQNNLRSSEKSLATIDVRFKLDNLSSQLALNYDGYNFNFDRSYLQYTGGIITFGLGAIDRHWSFSNKTSLILSNNARPSKSIYLKLNNKFDYKWLPSEANWSFEVFNGLTEGSLNNKKSMLLGARALLSPVEGLDFELVQTSQWGGEGYSTGLSALGASIFLDTNEDANYNINKMAGFGISYLIPNKDMPLRIYGQLIGEDEAGSLPSCHAYLAGFEWASEKIKYPTTLGLETVDTRTKTSTNGYCGPNSIYNNKIYNYTNYGEIMGAAINTEGVSVELFGKFKTSEFLNINFSTKATQINSENWSDHPLSSTYQSGLINSVGISWSKNNLKFNGSIYHQNFILDKASITKNYGIGLFSSKIF